MSVFLPVVDVFEITVIAPYATPHGYHMVHRIEQQQKTMEHFEIHCG